MDRGWSDNQIGDLWLGGKVNLSSQWRQQPAAFAVRGMIKLPTASEDHGAGTGKMDFAVDAIVSKEFNQRVANRPYGAANRRLFTQPMQGYVPYERSVIGSVEDLNAAKLPELKEFHDTYYRPNNATLVIVGDIETKQTQALVQAYFGDIRFLPAPKP